MSYIDLTGSILRDFKAFYIFNVHLIVGKSEVAYNYFRCFNS